jgi:hypothetical protein
MARINKKKLLRLTKKKIMDRDAAGVSLQIPILIRQWNTGGGDLSNQFS